jgi:hypothetical protein
VSTCKLKTISRDSMSTFVIADAARAFNVIQDEVCTHTTTLHAFDA